MLVVLRSTDNTEDGNTDLGMESLVASKQSMRTGAARSVVALARGRTGCLFGF